MKKVFSIARVLLLAILLGGILLWNQQTERRNAARLQQLQREAQPYYQEMTAIRLELQRREREIKIAHDVSGVIIGFVLSGCRSTCWGRERGSPCFWYKI